MKKQKKGIPTGIWGYVLFFGVVAGVITLAIPIYDFARQRSGGDKTTLALVMLLVIAFLAMICTVFDYIRRKIMIEKPLEDIRFATKRIAEGDFSVRLFNTRVAGSGYDEIMQNINLMAMELSKSEILKSDFISNVSHELKTPLAVIQSYCLLLQDKNLTAEDRDRYAKSLSDASKKLTTLVTNILKLNRLENQQIILDKSNVKLHSQLEECIVQYIDVIEEKNIELVTDIDEIEIETAGGYLEIVWSNLLSNAVKFTENGGQIKVSLKDVDGRAVVSVSDSGCGMTAEMGKHIFEKFYQGDTSHKQEGNGLGLALVKKVIDKLGGKISVTSELGKGSTFTVTV